MRAQPTPTESLLWQSLRNNQTGFHFYRQRPIDRFIVDFYCPSANLVIEVDGPIHQYSREEDALRIEFLESLGLTVLRFSSAQVEAHLPGVVDLITQALTARAIFLQANLAADWRAAMPDTRFDLVFAFAALHHLPSRRLRLDVLARVREALPPGGHFIHSEWQFHNSPKLVERIQPWERAGLNPADVEDGDALLDWRASGSSAGDVPALRYVHHFSVEELNELAAEAGFAILHSFHSDGAGGRLGLYQVWQLL
jgi:very-short-patch-repair endonuclease